MTKKYIYLIFSVTLITLFTNATYASDNFRTMARGSKLNGPNGILFDTKDRLYVASLFGREIVIMSSRSGRIIDRIGKDRGVEAPDDLAFGPDGSIYFTSYFTGEIGRIAPDGTTTKQYVGPGINPITFSDDGRLFAALTLSGDALYELDPNLSEPPQQIAENIGGLNGMDWGPDNALYAPIPNLGKIVRIDVGPTPAVIETIAEEGLVRPTAVKFDSQNRLHTVDSGNNQVSRVDIDTGAINVIATLPAGLDNLAFDSSDRLFVSNFIYGQIIHVYPNGHTRRLNHGGMIAPGGIAVVPRSGCGDSVYITDVASIREYNSRTGKEIGVYSIPNGILYPLTVSTAGEHLILSSWLANRVQIWDPETQEMLNVDTNYTTPLNAIRFQNTLIVAELGAGEGAARILQVSENETKILADAGNSVYVPVGLAATEDNLWVSDWATGMVWQISGPGNLVPIASELNAPEGLAVDQDGNLLVVETGAGRLTRIDVATGEIDIIAEKLDISDSGVPGSAPTWIFNGVAVDSSGIIYVTTDNGNRIYRSKK